MKKLGKNILLLAVTIGLVACGGGGTTTDDANTETNTSQIDIDNNTNNNTSTSTESNTSIEDSIFTSDSSDITEYLKAINDARSVEQNCGSYGIFPATTELIWNDKLESSAMEHSKDLASWNHDLAKIESNEAIARTRFDHNGSGTNSDTTAKALDLNRGSTVKERIVHAEYKQKRYGENITAGGDDRDTAVEAIQSLLISPNHCHILMDAEFTEVGMARVEDSNSFYINYWTQNFGTPQ